MYTNDFRYYLLALNILLPISDQSWWKEVQKSKQPKQKPDKNPSTRKQTSKDSVKNQRPASKFTAANRNKLTPKKAPNTKTPTVRNIKNKSALSKTMTQKATVKNEPKVDEIKTTVKNEVSKNVPVKNEVSKDDPVKNKASDNISPPAELNAKSYLPRLGLARAISKNDQEKSVDIYNEVIKMNPEVFFEMYCCFFRHL